MTAQKKDKDFQQRRDDNPQQIYSPEEIKKWKEKDMREKNYIITDGKGTEKKIYPPVELTPIQRPEVTTYEEALEWNKHSQETHEKMSLFTQEYAKVEFTPHNSNKVLIVNVGDTHWGHRDVDYDFLDENLKRIEYTPNIAGVLTWNLLDAAIPSQFPDGLLWSNQTAQEQVYTFRDKLKALHEKGKLLGGIGSAACHEGWGKKKMGWLVYRELFEGIDVPLLSNGSILDIVVGEQTYRLALAHSLRYWSSINETHGGLRMLDRVAEAEISFTAHHHRGAISQHYNYNPPFRKSIGIVASGTCKIKDNWLMDRIGEQGKPGFQGIMLWADKHKFNVIHELGIGRELIIDAIHNREERELAEVREELHILAELERGAEGSRRGWTQ